MTRNRLIHHLKWRHNNYNDLLQQQHQYMGKYSMSQVSYSLKRLLKTTKVSALCFGLIQAVSAQNSNLYLNQQLKEILIKTWSSAQLMLNNNGRLLKNFRSPIFLSLISWLMKNRWNLLWWDQVRANLVKVWQNYTSPLVARLVIICIKSTSSLNPWTSYLWALKTRASSIKWKMSSRNL